MQESKAIPVPDNAVYERDGNTVFVGGFDQNVS
jgi:hypothetical protein